MTDGTSQGLFIVVAIVIFGIFTLMAYILFEDTLSPALANMFTEATEQAHYGLKANENLLNKELWRDIQSNHGDYPQKTTIMTESGKDFARVIIDPNARVKRFSLYMRYNYSDMTRNDLAGKKVKISLKYRTNAIGHTFRFQYFLPSFGSANLDSDRRMLVNDKFTDTGWNTMSAIIEDYPDNLGESVNQQGIIYLHAGEIGDSYVDIQDVRIEVLD